MAIGFSNPVTKDQLEEVGFKLEEDFDYSGLIIGLKDNGEPIKLQVNIKTIFENGLANSNTFTAASDRLTFTEFINHLTKYEIDAISQIVLEFDGGKL